MDSKRLLRNSMQPGRELMLAGRVELTNLPLEFVPTSGVSTGIGNAHSPFYAVRTMNVEANDSMKLIMGRRSVRVYSPGAIPEATLTKLLEAGMAAPSAMAKDPWRFVVVRDTTMLKQLSGALPGGSMLSAASAAIVVCGDLDATFDRQISYLLQDCSACIQNILLAAHGHGLGACWAGAHPLEAAIRKVKELLNLPAPVIPVAAIALGLPGEAPEPRTRYNPAFVHNEQW